jgi:hypothetical protein
VILALALVLFLLSLAGMASETPTTGYICMDSSLLLILMGILASHRGTERIVVLE